MSKPREGDQRIVLGQLRWYCDGVWVLEEEYPMLRYFMRCPHDCGFWAELGENGACGGAIIHECQSPDLPPGSDVVTTWDDGIAGGDCAHAIEQGLRAIATQKAPELDSRMLAARGFRCE